jgi:hypothetical protein
MLICFSDWLPTIMSLITNDAWTGSMTNAEIDGFNIWPHLLENTPTPRTEMIHDLESESTFTVQQVTDDVNLKLMYGQLVNIITEPKHVFSEDRYPEIAVFECPESERSLISGVQETNTSSEVTENISDASADYSPALSPHKQAVTTLINFAHLNSSLGLTLWVVLLLLCTIYSVSAAVSRLPGRSRSKYDSIPGRDWSHNINAPGHENLASSTAGLFEEDAEDLGYHASPGRIPIIIDPDSPTGYGAGRGGDFVVV